MIPIDGPAQGPRVDVERRFREELREQELPARISLRGNPMLVAIATILLQRHAPQTIIDQTEGEQVELRSMESFGARFLASFLEDKEPPSERLLLHTIPEAELLSFAERHGIALVEEERDDVRLMLDRIAAQQPQTYYSLARSAQRLLAARKGQRT